MRILTLERWKLFVGGLALIGALTYGYQRMTTPAWEIVSTDFAKSDKPYGGGAFRLQGNEVITLKLAGAELKFKPESDPKNPEVAEFTELWMNNVHERLNRSTVSFMRGTLDGGMTRFFQQYAQSTAWWYSKDWSTLYVSTGWTDHTTPRSKSLQDFLPQITKLWRSVDGGTTWAQLRWPEDQNIGKLLFRDALRGYAIGWGPRVWRTADGGQSWQEIPLPPMATDPREPRKTFNAADLGPDGTLRVGYYVPMLGKIQLSSVVYRLRWDATQFEQDVVLPDQVIVQLATTDDPPGYTYSIYALSRLGLPRNYEDLNDKGHRPGAISTWASYTQPKVDQLHTFDERYRLDGLSAGKRGLLLVYATDATREGAPHDITFYSRDFGKAWNEIDDGIGQGGWFDPQTNTQYALSAYTLKKRSF